MRALLFRVYGFQFLKGRTRVWAPAVTFWQGSFPGGFEKSKMVFAANSESAGEGVLPGVVTVGASDPTLLFCKGTHYVFLGILD